MQNRSTAINYGGYGRVDLSTDWQLRAGVFRSIIDDERTFSNLLLDLTPDGRANQLIIADPPSRVASTSGEIRLSRKLSEGPRLHVVHLNARARDRRKSFDGSAEIDLGPTRIGAPVTAAQPAYQFGKQTQDRVRQWTGGIAYEGRWKDVGELSVGLQKTDYRKRIVQPGLAPTATEDRPWLYNVTAAGYVTSSIAIYAGYTKGLEESGVAPVNASNRNEALPAIITSQRDAGVRVALTKDIRFVAGVFDVRKPYFNLDASDRFAELGDIKNQGIELSFSGSITPRLNIVTGAVLLRPRVTGEGVALGRVGPRPVGLPTRSIDFNADWRLPGLEGVSVDLSASHVSRVIATRDNLVSIPSRTLVDIGGRYRFKLAGKDATLRASVSNITDEQGFDLRGAGAYDIISGRVASAYLAIDF